MEAGCPVVRAVGSGRPAAVSMDPDTCATLASAVSWSGGCKDAFKGPGRVTREPGRPGVFTGAFAMSKFELITYWTSGCFLLPLFARGLAPPHNACQGSWAIMTDVSRGRAALALAEKVRV